MSMNVTGANAAELVDNYGTSIVAVAAADEDNVFDTGREAQVDGYYGTTSSVASNYSSTVEVNGEDVDLDVSLSSTKFKISTARVSGNTYTNLSTTTTGTVDGETVTSVVAAQILYYTDEDGNATGIKSISFNLDGDGSQSSVVDLQYDEDGNLISETKGFYAENEGEDGETAYEWTNETTSYNYDDGGNLTYVQYADGTISYDEIAPDKAPSITNKSGLAGLIADYSAQIFAQKVETTELQSQGKVSTKSASSGSSSSSSSSSSSTAASNEQVKTWLESLVSSNDSNSFMYTVAKFLLTLWDLIDISSSDEAEETEETEEAEETEETEEAEEN